MWPNLKKSFMKNFIFCAVVIEIGRVRWNISEVYSEPCQISKMELFLKVVIGLKQSFFYFLFCKNSILNDWQGTKYASDFTHVYC